MDLARVFAFLDRTQASGLGGVLVTVCAVEGSSMRNPGTHMGVAEDGSFEGSLSGGCIENAVVSEALDALACGSSRIVRFGVGSPYLDIKLPCGGGLDIHFQPLVDNGFVAQCGAMIAARRPFSVRLEAAGVRCVERYEAARFDSTRNSGVFGHWPEPRLLIIGHGAGVEALARLGQSMHCSIDVLTSDKRVLDQITTRGISGQLLTRTSDTHLLASDRWTAIVFLFHDHDWEIELMAQALALPHFYLGAMGGRRAHAFRSDALSRFGVSAESIETIHAPIGLFHSSRDPHSLALSALGEVISAYQQAEFAEDNG